MTKFNVHYTTRSGESTHSEVIEAKTPDQAAKILYHKIPAAKVFKIKTWKAS